MAEEVCPRGKDFGDSSEKNGMGRGKGTRDTGGSTRAIRKKSVESRPSGKPESAGGKKFVSLRDQVHDGTYRVDPDAVAEKMVDDAVRKIRSRIRPQ